MSSAVNNTTRACLDAADEALRAAQAIAAEPSCAPRSAAGPLISATQALARATAPDRPAPVDSEPGTWLPAEVWAQLSERERETQRWELPVLLAEARRAPEAPGPFPLTRAQVLAHAARLGRLTAASRVKLGGGSLRGRSAWPRRLLVAAGVVVLAVLVARPWQSPSFGPWRGAYYSRHDFTGEVIVRNDLDLRFDWGKSPPFDEVPANKYSIRWETCLTLDRAIKASFQMTTDNSMRLYIDGKIVLNNWGAKELRARGITTKLAAGVHHVRVDYQKTNRESHLALTASLDGEPPKPLPYAQLDAPSVDADGVASCEGAVMVPAADT